MDLVRSHAYNAVVCSKAFAKCGRIQLDLGQLTVSHFMKVHERSTLPLEKFLENDFAVCLSLDLHSRLLSYSGAFTSIRLYFTRLYTHALVSIGEVSSL